MPALCVPIACVVKVPVRQLQDGRWLAVAGAVSRAHLKSWKRISMQDRKRTGCGCRGRSHDSRKSKLLAESAHCSQPSHGVKAWGFVSPHGGLDQNSISESFLDRFSEPVLSQLGVGHWRNSRDYWAGRTLSRNVIDGRRIPSLLRMLLLARLVTDDIARFGAPWHPVLHSKEFVCPQVTGQPLA